ncbi:MULTISPECIES: NOP5/NOP56 family protein [unclassified Methanoregula]|uniref:NOP5/NOP56 family protein n=1 Tax=unclassified Methanoregula TaxID=2649730 RepID=UPI0009CA3048|nr:MULTISPECIES: NOP5/NOP56 family protein [unclassified Methanoregula]OPX61629.1 MAG: putative NOP5 family protein [Methanoregula sp. PtaB.Bin085]OPY34062.1 MAG: putative NOP5 family protein [Methanoregula sp. PtaU1.Bin006]
MQSYWFGDFTDGRCQPFTGDRGALVSRILSLSTRTDISAIPDWQTAVSCGFCHDRAEYLALLQDACIAAAERSVKEQYSGKDAELLQMVRTLDEIDTVINLLSERATDWYMVRHPAFSRKYRRIPAHTLIRTMQEKSRGALGKVAGEIAQLAETRTALAKEVSARANGVMPNTSALIGGLVAARLMAHAGGLQPLSRLPASAIQVLGARTALFAHIRTRTPSPKHGIIFQHRRVHNAPRGIRGRVARVLSGKLAIAARLDHFRGAADPEFLAKAQEHIDAAGKGGEA